MKKIIARLKSISGIVEKKKLKQLSIIVEALLSMRGRMTMLGLSRWTEKGGSYRTITRFFNSKINWEEINWKLIQANLIKKEQIYLLAGDEVIVSKSGKKSYGIDRFYSSIVNKPIKSLAFLNLSLIDVSEKKAYSLTTQQIVKENAEGCIKYKNSKKESKSTNYLSFVKNVINPTIQRVREDIKVNYFLFDGAMGYDNAVKMVKECDLDIISKLRKDSALIFPNEEKYKGRGRPKKFGDKIDYKNLDEKYCKETITENRIITKIYQMKMLHHKFSKPLNIVIIKKFNLINKKSAQIILFSSDLNLNHDKLILYYSLRFQIEFVFRDAKQYWGMEDFMNIKQISIHNWANLSTFMVNFSHVLLQNKKFKNMSILDLKAHYHGLKYLKKLFILLPNFFDNSLIQKIKSSFTSLGAIHQFKEVA